MANIDQTILGLSGRGYKSIPVPDVPQIRGRLASISPEDAAAYNLEWYDFFRRLMVSIQVELADRFNRDRTDIANAMNSISDISQSLSAISASLDAINTEVLNLKLRLDDLEQKVGELIAAGAA